MIPCPHALVVRRQIDGPILDLPLSLPFSLPLLPPLPFVSQLSSPSSSSSLSASEIKRNVWVSTEWVVFMGAIITVSHIVDRGDHDTVMMYRSALLYTHTILHYTILHCTALLLCSTSLCFTDLLCSTHWCTTLYCALVHDTELLQRFKGDRSG